MKELLQLYFLFFKMGIVNFGGGYAMLPLLDRELVEKRNWATSEELADYYAVGQCTPGAIAVNVSTFIGMKRHGIWGGILATLGFISPAFLIIFVIASLLTNFSSNIYVLNALAGIRVCVFFLVLSAIVKLVKKSVKDVFGALIMIIVGLMAIFVDAIPLYVYVILAAVFGVLINVIKEKRRIKKEENSDESTEEKSIKEEVVKSNKGMNLLFSFIGFLLGIAIGPFGILLGKIIKNPSYKKGVYASLVLWFIVWIGLIVLFIYGDPIIFVLYLQFFKVGICAFGGGLATIPFLKELGESTGWFTQLDLANMIAVSESTPGAMGVNMSTYVGYMVLNNYYHNLGLSFVGSIISTLGLVSPSIIVITIVASFLNKFKTNKYVEWVFYGLRAASVGLVIAALYSILEVSLFNQYQTITDGVITQVDCISHSWNLAFSGLSGFEDFFPSLANFMSYLFNWKAVAIGLLFGIGIFKFKKHPILYIAIAALCGIVFQMYSVIII